MTHLQLLDIAVILNSVGLWMTAVWETRHRKEHKRMEEDDRIYRNLLAFEFEQLEIAFKTGNRIEAERRFWRIAKVIKTKGGKH